jgi:hypothetical protein
MSQQLIKLDPGKLAIFGDKAVNTKFSAGIKSGEFLPKISIKGREFALVIAGERKRLNERTLNVVIVDARASVSKTFYENPWSGAGEAKAPECSSADGITPDVGVPKPQNTTCQLCPHNAWKSGTNGKGKRCADSKVLVVVPANKLDGQPFQLQIPAASLKAFGAYVKTLDTHGIPVNGVVTQLSFTDDEYPALEFAFVDTLPSQEAYEQVLAIAERSDVKDVLRGIVTQSPEQHPAVQPVTIQKPQAAPPVTTAATFIPEGATPSQPETPAAPALDAGTQSEIDSIISAWETGK